MAISLLWGIHSPKLPLLFLHILKYRYTLKRLLIPIPWESLSSPNDSLAPFLQMLSMLLKIITVRLDWGNEPSGMSIITRLTKCLCLDVATKRIKFEFMGN